MLYKADRIMKKHGREGTLAFKLAKIEYNALGNPIGMVPLITKARVTTCCLPHLQTATNIKWISYMCHVVQPAKVLRMACEYSGISGK